MAEQATVQAPPKPPSRRYVVQKRRARVGDLMAEGRSIFFIAKTLKVSQSVVSNDMRICREAWVARQAIGRDVQVAQMVAFHKRVDGELWDAWRRSCQPAERRVAKTIDGGAQNGGRTEAQMVTEAQAGDVSFMMGLLRSAHQQCQLLGLYAPTRNVSEIYLGVEAVFDGDTVAEEEARVEEILAKVQPAMRLLTDDSGGNDAAGVEWNGHGSGNGNGTGTDAEEVDTDEPDGTDE